MEWWSRQREAERKQEAGSHAGSEDDQSLVEFGTLCWGGRLCDDSCTFHGPWPDLWISPVLTHPPFLSVSVSLRAFPSPRSPLSATLVFLSLVRLGLALCFHFNFCSICRAAVRTDGVKSNSIRTPGSVVFRSEESGKQVKTKAKAIPVLCKDQWAHQLLDLQWDILIGEKKKWSLNSNTARLPLQLLSYMRVSSCLLLPSFVSSLLPSSLWPWS